MKEKEENYFINSKIDREILDIQNFGYQTVEIHRKDSKDWYVYQLEEKDNKFLCMI